MIILTPEQQVDWKLMTNSGAILDTLIALIESGPLWDGDVPSKGGRDTLIEQGFAIRVIANGEDGYTAATYLGRDLYKWYYGANTIAEAKQQRIALRAVNSVKNMALKVQGGAVTCTKCNTSSECRSAQKCSIYADINLWK